MARPKSEVRREAILAAAARVIAQRGLTAPTAEIAKEAGVSNGSLFTYFETKADLLNQLYVALKSEMSEVVLHGLSSDQDVREQMAHVWAGWLRWAASDPFRRRALAQLSVSDEIGPESRKIGGSALIEVATLLERSRSDGPMRAVPLGMVVGLMSAVAEATVDFILTDPGNSDAHQIAGFEAMWRMIAGPTRLDPPHHETRR